MVSLYIPERIVNIETATDYGAATTTQSFQNLYVTPTGIETIDAARLTVPKADRGPV